MDLRGIFRKGDRGETTLNTTNLKNLLGGSDDVIFSDFHIGSIKSI